MENNYKGLSSSEVLSSRKTHGANILTPPKKEPVWKLFLEKFSDPIIRILLIAALLSLVISVIHGEYTETIGIIFAILLATGVGFWFEYDAGRKFDMLNAVSDTAPVRVMRDGNICEIPKTDVVVGDIILLETGEEVPADGELLKSQLLSINESALTGEPSISKTADPAHFKKDATYPSNMLLRGTTVLEGHGVMRVTKVGDATELGKVAAAATEKSGEKTPLTKQLEKLAGLIGVGGFAVALLTFSVMFIKDIFFGPIDYSLGQIGLLGAALAGVAVSLTKVWSPILCDGIKLMSKGKVHLPVCLSERGWRFFVPAGIVVFILIAAIGYGFGVNPLLSSSWIPMEAVRHILNFFMIAVTIIVVAVPEGLPMSVTLSLALNMRRMLKSNNLVRKMHACETMGAINIICTDKTGTLTCNQMRVNEPFFFSSVDDASKSSLFPIIMEGMAVNSTAHLDRSQPEIKTLGNPTEAAIILWLNSLGHDYAAIRESVPVLDQITFSTERKYMATKVRSKVDGQCVIYIKGAPEVILGRCSKVAAEKGEVDADSMRDKIMNKLYGYQNQAMRTLGFAYKVVSEEGNCQNEIEAGGFTMLGITSIADPVREDVPDAVKECIDAGIAVKIVTGDTPGTAKEIARRIGLWNDAVDTDRNHITGADFEALSDEELLERVLDIKIMSRARPTDKQRFVRLLQKRGGVVAVTGDGTNDAPALNYAQVGLSMGSGTSVAKEASDITLLDDSFKSIATAVMWGRSLYKNIQRFLLFQLTINVIAISVVFIGAIMGSDSPLTITQMLWVNLIMDTFAAAALASLPPSKRVMKDKPRGVDDFIITRPMAINILGVGFSLVAVLMILLGFFETEAYFPLNYGLSMFFSIFVMIQAWNMFNAKAFGTLSNSAFSNMKGAGAFVAVVAIIILGQVAIVSWGGQMFRVVPLSFRDWIIIIASTSAILWIGEIIRFVRRSVAKK